MCTAVLPGDRAVGPLAPEGMGVEYMWWATARQQLCFMNWSGLGSVVSVVLWCGCVCRGTRWAADGVPAYKRSQGRS